MPTFLGSSRDINGPTVLALDSAELYEGIFQNESLAAHIHGFEPTVLDDLVNTLPRDSEQLGRDDLRHEHAPLFRDTTYFLEAVPQLRDLGLLPLRQLCYERKL